MSKNSSSPNIKKQLNQMIIDLINFCCKINTENLYFAHESFLSIKHIFEMHNKLKAKLFTENNQTDGWTRMYVV
jgi:hypothetical protein